MSDGSGIEWTDATWNVVIGCDKVSPGCDNCYAIRTAHRMQANPNPKVSLPYAGTEADGEWTGRVNLVSDRLDLPLRWRKPRRIFVNAQSDLFHDDVPEAFIGAVFDIMAKTPRHTYQILTKRHARMRALLTKWATQVPGDLPQYKAAFRSHQDQWAMVRQWPLPNVHLVVSVENQQWADIRIPALLDTPAAVRGISVEPMLGPIELFRCHCAAKTRPPRPPVPGAHYKDCPALLHHGLDWVIVGGESGRGARPMHPDWARSLRDQCVAAGVPFLFKQWGEFAPHDVTLVSVADVDDEGCMSFVHRERVVEGMRRVGKKAAGRVLDGRTWDEFPGGDH